MNTGVYCIKNEINKKLYIGSTTKGFSHRKGIHFLSLQRNKHENPHLQAAYNKYGENNFNFIILEKVVPEECLTREQWYLDNWPTDYNICKIAGSKLGVKHSPEAKLKMRLAHLGRKASLETRKKLSEIGKKQFFSEQRKLNISNGRKKPIQQLDKTTGVLIKIWPSALDAAKHFGYDKIRKSISLTCLHKTNSSIGFKWEFVKPREAF